MINPRDLYTLHTVQPITASTTTYGSAVITYEVRRYRDVRNLSHTFAYHILCTQRIVIPNATPYTPGGTSITEFSGYPAIVTNNISLGGLPPVKQAGIVSYSPRTINAAVSTSFSNNTGTAASTTMQHTSGSSTSQSNSFGASASVGFFGFAATGGVSVDYDHSWGSERSSGTAAGTESGTNSQSGSGESMSVKDWGCFASLDSGNQSITWTWGQEYPWNVIQLHNNNGGDSISLPGYVSSLLYDGSQVLPPSELSQFGIDFTMKGAWYVEPVPSNAASGFITHTMTYYTASHNYSASTVHGTINPVIPSSAPFVYTSPQLDLPLLGLDPIQRNGPGNVAIIGFIPRQFLVKPVPYKAIPSTQPVKFTILSGNNTLLVRDTTQYAGLTTADQGAGFSPSETALMATFTQNCASLQMTLSFKVIDMTNNYRLFMKHWKMGGTGVMLNIVINGDTDNPIVKYVDALEAEGGENNLMSISLRNMDYGSVDYHDFLQPGVNTIQITLTPNGAAAGCGYQLRAVSIERE